MWCRKLCVVAATSMSSTLCRELFCIHPFHFYYNVFSAESHSQSLFPQFASSKLKMSEADITHVLKLAPHLEKLRTLDNIEKIIRSFMNHGCTKSQAANILRKHYQLIGSTEKILEPKLKLMEGFGFVGGDLAKLMTRNPYFLHFSLQNNILPTMEFLKDVFQSKDVLVKALLNAPRILTCSLEKTLKPSLAFWEGWGFSATELVSFLQLPVIELEPCLKFIGRSGCGSNHKCEPNDSALQPAGDFELSPELKRLCERVGESLKETGASLIRDPRCPAQENDRFLNMMETYFEKSDQFKRMQEHPHLKYQAILTKGNMAKF